MTPQDYMPQPMASCVICGAGFVSFEYLAAHFQRRHPNQMHLLHSGPQSNRQDRPVDQFAPMVDSSIGGMHGDAFGASAHMGGAPFGGASNADYPPMNEPMRGRGYAEHGWAGFHERDQRGPAGGHGGRSGYSDLRGGYGGGGGGGGGGGYQGGFGQPAACPSEYDPPRRPPDRTRQAYKRQYEELGMDEFTAPRSRRRTDGKLSGTAHRWNDEKVKYTCQINSGM